MAFDEIVYGDQLRIPVGSSVLLLGATGWLWTETDTIYANLKKCLGSGKSQVAVDICLNASNLLSHPVSQICYIYTFESDDLLAAKDVLGG